MKVFLAIKFEHGRNRELISSIERVLREDGHQSSVFVNQGEQTGNREMMEQAFEDIKGCDALLIEYSKKGVGLGIEAGFAYVLGKPIYVVHRKGTKLSPTLAGICKNSLQYNHPSEIPKVFE